MLKIKNNIFLNKIKIYISLTRLNNPNGIFLLLWPTLSSMFFANREIPNIKLIFFFLSEVILMRSAGCIINDIIDCKIDINVSRTRYRPIAQGLIKKNEAYLLFFILILTAIFLVLLNFKLINIFLCFISLIFMCIYPFMKRYISFPQVFLGLSFSFTVPIVWSAIVGHCLSIECWLLFFANFFWTIAYDTQYALMDIKDDIKIGVKSTAILFGKYVKFIIFLIQIIFIFILIILGIRTNLNFLFWLFIILILLTFLYQNYLLHNNYINTLKVFTMNNYVGIFLCCGFLFNTKTFT